jgi:hypothetical protein
MLARANKEAAKMIATRLSVHAQRQAQRRGVARQTLDLVLMYADSCPEGLARFGSRPVRVSS